MGLVILAPIHPTELETTTTPNSNPSYLLYPFSEYVEPIILKLGLPEVCESSTNAMR